MSSGTKAGMPRTECMKANVSDDMAQKKIVASVVSPICDIILRLLGGDKELIKEMQDGKTYSSGLNITDGETGKGCSALKVTVEMVNSHDVIPGTAIQTSQPQLVH